MNLGYEDARTLGEHAMDLAWRGRALVQFAAREPELARMAGVEVQALEVKAILHGGALERLTQRALGHARMGAHVALVPGDVEQVTRLSDVVRLADARIQGTIQSIDQSQAGRGLEGLGTVIGLASGAIGLFKAIF